MRKLKLIWEFRGGDAEGTAKHHAIHLEEFAKKEALLFEAGYEVVDEFLTIAFLIIEEDKMIMVRDALRPQRGEWVS